MAVWIALAILWHLAAACTSSEPGGHAPQLVYEDSAGVEVIRVGYVQDTVRVDGPLIRIGGGSSGEKAEAALFLVTDVAVLSGNRIIVVDNRAIRVAVFDSMGNWISDIGGRGRGPGEYEAPVYVHAVNDTLHISDASLRRLLRYDPDLQFAGALTLHNIALERPFKAFAAEYIVEIESGQMTDASSAQGAVVRFTHDGELRDTIVEAYEIPEFGWRLTGAQAGEGIMVNPPAFEIYPPWSISSGLLHFLRPKEAVVEIRDLRTGEVKRIIQTPTKAAPPTEADRESFFTALTEEFALPPEALSAVRASTEFAALRPRVAGLSVDDLGRIWIGEHDPAGRARRYVGSAWLVVDPDNGTTEAVIFPERFDLRQVRGQRAYGITVLDNGVHVVDVMPIMSTHAPGLGR